MSNHTPIEDFATAPGETLLECIEALGMSQVDLATRTGLDEQTINLIIQGTELITHQAALAFEQVLRVPAHFWLNMETNDRLLHSDKLRSGKRHARRCKDAQWCIEAPSEILQKHIGILHLT